MRSHKMYQDDSQNFIDHRQHTLPLKYQELEAFVRQQAQVWQDHDAKWKAKFAQDEDWKLAINGKLEIIISHLQVGHSSLAAQAGSSQTIHGGYLGQ